MFKVCTQKLPILHKVMSFMAKVVITHSLLSSKLVNIFKIILLNFRPDFVKVNRCLITESE